ncbi:hypothetical protein [Streptomyces sp. NPDC090798]|uniref:hypothetical protein n=1 Tax=Streptomyces sp. NPDC090798 TaxID=3365968 RepID=UPI0037F9A340
MALPVPGRLPHSTAADGVVRLVNHGCDRLPPPPAPDEDSPHCTRFACAGAAPPDTAVAGIDAGIPDSPVGAPGARPGSGF